MVRITIHCGSVFIIPEPAVQPTKKRLHSEAFLREQPKSEDYRLWVKVRVMTSRCCSGVRALKRTA